MEAIVLGLHGTEDRKTISEDRKHTTGTEEEIIINEVESQIKKLKNRKMAGKDKMKNKA